jgi:hypothetical protein
MTRDRPAAGIRATIIRPRASHLESQAFGLVRRAGAAPHLGVPRTSIDD